MRYTYRRLSGAVVILLGVMILSRFAPDWLFYSLFAIVLLLLLYLFYNISTY